MGEAANLEGRKLLIYWPDDPLSKTGIDSHDYEWFMMFAAVEENAQKYLRIIVRNCYSRCVDPRFMMRRLHSLMATGGVLALEEYYGSSDEAYEHPDFKRPVFKNSFTGYWPQWEYTRRVFYLDGNFIDPEADPGQMGMAVANLRNVVRSFTAELRCWRPNPAQGDFSPPAPTDPASAFKVI